MRPTRGGTVSEFPCAAALAEVLAAEYSNRLSCVAMAFASFQSASQ